MFRMKNKGLRTCLLLLILQALLFGIKTAEAQDEYIYSDNYSTDQAINDSYLHSPFVDSLPHVYLYGVLMYRDVPAVHRALGFYSGWEVDADAYLNYNFPLGGEQGIITFGTVEIQVLCDSSLADQYLGLQVSYDGEIWSDHDLSESGLHLLILLPPSSCHQVSLKFTGGADHGYEGPQIDRFKITLDIYGDTNVDQISLDTEYPGTYVLSQNYPNPFNATTKIHYQLPEAGLVTLKIINTLGQEVRRLVDGRQEAGEYRIMWDGRDAGGDEVSSGLYFCRMTAGEFEKMVKIVTIK